MTARASLLAIAALAAGCGGARPDGATPAPLPGRPLEAYARQGLITGDERFPVVAGFASVAGPADSTWLIFGMSFPAEALRFHLDGESFVAGYTVRLRFTRNGMERALSERSHQVRVATFEETGRTDDAIIYQDYVLLEPGPYIVEVGVADSIGGRGVQRTDTIDVPDYRARQSALVLVHEAVGRVDRARPPRLVLNSRRSTAYGGTAPRIYVELYDTLASDVHIVATAADDLPLLSLPVRMERVPAASVATATMTLPVDSLPLGIVTLSVRHERASAGPTEPMLVTISDQWMVANYDEVLDYLAYIATTAEIDTLRAASTVAGRRAAWEAFWARRDPVPASAVNEYREEFFQRVRIASEQFAETGRPGWRTDRGRVYIVLGPPDRVTIGEIDRRDIGGAADAIEWYYDRPGAGRVQLVFVDTGGFGRFEMTRTSELAFRAVAERLRRGDG